MAAPLRFDFHTDDGLPLRDREGVELKDEAQARIEAVRVLGGLLQDAPLRFWSSGQLAVEVESDDGPVVRLRAVTERSSPATSVVALKGLTM